MKSLPDILRRWRKKRGLSQLEAAAVIGVPLDTLQNWEQGRNAPSGYARAALLIAIRKP